MSDQRLFLGLPISDTYLQELKELPLPVRETFIQEQPSDYLQQIEREGVFYLGKSIGSPYDMASIDSLETHIYSLLRKLIPDYPYDQHPLLLLPLENF